MDAIILSMLRPFPRGGCCLRQRVPGFSTLAARCAPPQHDPRAEWQLSEESRERLARQKRHPGMLRTGMVDLPVDLNLAINRVLMKFDARNIRQDAQQFRQQILHRVPAPEQKDIKARASKLEQEYVRQHDLPTRRSRLTDSERLQIRAQINDVVLPKLKSEFYQWKRVEYTPYRAALYLATRYPEEFQIMRRIFTELQRRVHDFAPTTLFDYGSGVGTVAMAANEVFKESMQEYFCVDYSPDMNDIARAIVENGGEGREPLLKKAYFRQFLPGKHDRTFDIVTSAFTLMDLGESRDRLEVVRMLWRKTNRFFILVEQGNTLGYRTIMEARDHILQIDRDSKKPVRNPVIKESVGGGRVFAPCPHSQECPRLANASNRKEVVCRFPVAFNPLPLMSYRAAPKNTGTFSYVVLEKDPVIPATTSSTTADAPPAPAPNTWPRVVQPLKKRHHHVICRMCCPDGELRELISTKSKHQDTFYALLRRSKWGDRVPLTTAEMAGTRKLEGEEVERMNEEEEMDSAEGPETTERRGNDDEDEPR